MYTAVMTYESVIISCSENWKNFAVALWEGKLSRPACSALLTPLFLILKSAAEAAKM